ncbi:hypothetical protein Tco_0120126, partial [Tanacetum coccineum]
MAKKLLALIRQRLNVTTATREVTLLEKVGHQGIKGIEMEMLQEGLYANALVVQDGIGLESLEARIVFHQKNEAVYEEDIAFLKYDVKNGIGFDSQMTENELHDIHKNNNEVLVSASDNSVNEIEEENNQVNDRFKKIKGYHAVPPPYTGNYMPSRPDLSFAGLDDYVY